MSDYPYESDLGDGTFRNPVLCADYSDPDLIRVGDDYYLIASSFNAIPGLPVLHSKDLIHWEIVAHALDRLPGERFARPIHGQGVWAPSLREHAGTYFVVFPIYCKPDDDGECEEEGIWVTTAPSPTGPWSAPHQLLAERGVIDPSLFWDDDGQAYLIYAYAELRAGVSDRLDLVPISSDATRIVGTSRILFSDPAHYPIIEGPKLYQRDAWYYILAPAGGVWNGFQVALRSRSILGPYEARIVLEQGETAINGPHQGGMVDTPDHSEWWFLHFQDAGPYGRVVHLNPVEWEDGWPLMGRAGTSGRREPVVTHEKPALPRQGSRAPATSDDFALPDLGRQWQWQANPQARWFSLSEQPGCLRLFAEPVAGCDLAQASNLLLQKVPARSFDLETRVRAAGLSDQSCAGLVVWGAPEAALLVHAQDDSLHVRLIVGGQVLGTDRLAQGTIRLRVSFADGAVCRFGYGNDGTELRWFPDPVQFAARWGTWTGVKLGLVALSPSASANEVRGYADFECFEFSPFGG